MKSVFVLFLLLRSCRMEEICNCFREDCFSKNVTSDAPIRISLHHNFLQIEKGIVPGIKYNVTLRNKNGDVPVLFALKTKPAAALEQSSTKLTSCDSTKIVGKIVEESTFFITAPLNLNETLLFLFAIKTIEDQTWTNWLQEFPVRSNCYYTKPESDLVLVSEELFEIHTILIQSPDSSGLRIDLDAALTEKDATLSIQNISESSIPLFYSSSSDNSQRTFTLEENKFLLVDSASCYNCRFRISISPMLTHYECNTTLTIEQGSLELSNSQSNFCELQLMAPTSRRIFVKILKKGDIINRNCHTLKLYLNPLLGVPTQTIWNSCSNASQFYISDKNMLKLHWDESLEDTVLNYKFLPSCWNQTFSENFVGDFCNPGYPDIILGCNSSYFIYVPLGYSIELQVNVLGYTVGAFCHSSLEILAHNATSGNKLLSKLCLDGTEKQKNSFTVQTSNNQVILRSNIKSDLPHKGFCASYKALPSNSVLFRDCPYGWISGDKFCYKLYDNKLNWMEAEKACETKNGHLVSITDDDVAELIDNIIKSNPLYERSHAFWIGANDLRYENCYEWTDGQPFDFFYWFPGWEDYGWYSMQPSDDGLSEQNCVELRNLFRYPSKGEGKTDRFFWNDRDCRVENPFICQRLKPGMSFETVSTPACNQSVSLSLDHFRHIITSPGFPHNYPNNVECHYFIEAPPRHRIVVMFTDFVLEKSESCEFDVLTLKDLDKKWHRCGDWSGKIKLLRHLSIGNTLHITFTSDFSHSFKGFRIEISLHQEDSKEETLCDNEMFQVVGKTCYLVVNYPETSWSTARQICSEAKARLAIVQTEEQVALLQNLVRSAFGYISGVIYWVGAYSINLNNTWKWMDGSVTHVNDMRITPSEVSLNPTCLAIQFRTSNTMRWTSRNCNQPGRFICQKPSIVVPEDLNKTVSQLKGNLSSANYPANYLNNLDYLTEVIGPSNSRVVLTFHQFDLEWQQDCLYDYIILQTDRKEKGIRLCGEQLEKREFVSTTNKAYLSFHSDFSTTATGYLVSWDIVDLSVCFNRRLLILELTYISSLRYPNNYLSGYECRLTVTASEPRKQLLLTIVDLDISSCSKDKLEINLDPRNQMRVVQLCSDLPGTQFLSYGNEASLLFQTAEGELLQTFPRRGYNITVETWEGSTLERDIHLNTIKNGRIYSLNFNQQQPLRVNYSQRLIAPTGYKIHLKLLNMSEKFFDSPMSCEGSGLVIRDLHKILIFWSPCQTSNFEKKNGFWSTLHILNIVSWNLDGSLPSYFIDYSIRKDDNYLNRTLTTLEWCDPNPCQHGGRCIREGTTRRCHCFGQYTGLLCHLTWCEVNVCGENGVCNLTSNGWTCDCFPGYGGRNCQSTPCLPNPCQSEGVCSVQNGTFSCHCVQDFEGSHCEKLVMRIPYKPLRQRMLEEPFWLGLITVFSVLVVILCVYCIKRKFADKIEKFLAEEIERSKYQPSPPASRYSSSQAGNESPQTCPKSSFISRIRKNSLLSISTPDRERTFIFDNILRKPSSKRNKPSSSNSGNSGINNSGYGANDAAEKSRILASLVNPNKEAAGRRVSLDDFIRMRESKLHLGRTDSDGGKKETSFITEVTPKSLRESFSEIQSIQEQSFEYMSSSESLSGEPKTSEVQADVSYSCADSQEKHSTPETCSLQNHSDNTAQNTPTNHSKVPSISITIDPCDSNEEPFQHSSPVMNREVPPSIPAIQVFSAESDEQQENCCNKSIEMSSSPPFKNDFTQPRKYSIDLPMPKILITANVGSCDYDEASPPRTPNPNKSMIYLSPLAVISSTTDRTISESNLSTSGYSSISSPGLSRCNSSSPISDDVEHHHNPNCSRKTDIQSPKKPHESQMTYLCACANDKEFVFPPALACHCHSSNQSNSVILEPQNSSVPAVWGTGKHRLLYKRNSYQTTSTDDSIDDEGISMDGSEFKKSKGDIRNMWNVMNVRSEMFSSHLPTNLPLLMDSSKPDLLNCSMNNTQGNGNKGSPRINLRKVDKHKKHSEKHRRSPIISPAITPVADQIETAEARISRNSSRTSMSGQLLSSSESDDKEMFQEVRQARRSKKHDFALAGHKPSQDSPKSSDATGRSSPLSESNGDSAPIDSRSPASSSSESLKSTRDMTLLEKSYCSRHKHAIEHALSFPPLNQCTRQSDPDSSKEVSSKGTVETMKKSKAPLRKIESKESRAPEEHPCLRRQEAVVEDDQSDDSSSETTVLLGRPSESPKQCSSAEISEWEAFSKE